MALDSSLDQDPSSGSGSGRANMTHKTLDPDSLAMLDLDSDSMNLCPQHWEKLPVPLKFINYDIKSVESQVLNTVLLR
jgi:hypothetical protein